MEKNDKYLNFFGDSQNYKLHNPLPNPYGLRGNPDLNANSADQGDGLNGTPDYRSFTGEVQDDAWSNHPGFIGINWGGNNNNDEPNTLSDGQIDANNDGLPDYMDVGPQPEPNADQESGGGFISGLFGGGDGMKTYYTCQNGQVVSGQYKRNQQPAGWGKSRANACLSPTQIADKKANTWNTIGNIFKSINTGFQTGVGVGSPNAGGGTGGGVIDPGGTTTTTTQAGMGGDTSKIIGWVLVAGVVFGLGYMAIKAAGAPRPDFYND